MKKRLHKGFTFVELLVILVVIGFLFVVSAPSHMFEPPPIRARVSELILAASSAKTALSEGMQKHETWSATWMSSITISATGMISSATVGPAGQIIVYGTAPTSNASVTLTPTITTDFKLVWSCSGEPHKYMPASCR